MSKDTPSAPAPVVVNPGATAGQQAEFNRDAALQQRALGLVDQYTPQGSVTYESTGEEVAGIPTYKVTQSYSPEQQALYDTSTDIQQQYADIGQAQLEAVGEKLSSPFNMGQFGAAPTYNQDYQSQQVQNMMTRMQPQFDQRKAALETQLANQGFVTGTQAYDTAMDEYYRSLNDAQIAADIQGTALAGQMYGLETNARDRAINEALMERTQPMSELAALVSGSQPSTGQFLPTPSASVAPVDYAGMEYGSANQANTAAQNQYNAQMGSYNADLGGLYGLGAAGLTAAGYAWSDRRLKKDINKIGKIMNGLAVYTFRYIWGGPVHVGLMAQDVMKVNPKAVKDFGGFMAVNYAEAVK